jgi:hypothetical protein
MKTLIISFAIWVFVVPALVAVFLIFKFVADSPDLYPALASLALAFSILTLVWGRFWLAAFSSASFWLFPKSQQRANSIQEEKDEKCLEG